MIFINIKFKVRFKNTFKMKILWVYSIKFELGNSPHRPKCCEGYPLRSANV